MPPQALRDDKNTQKKKLKGFLKLSAYLQSGLLKCPLLKMMPLNGALNSMSTTIPALEHWTSMRLIVGIIMATAVVSAKIWAGTICFKKRERERI